MIFLNKTNILKWINRDHNVLVYMFCVGPHALPMLQHIIVNAWIKKKKTKKKKKREREREREREIKQKTKQKSLTIWKKNCWWVLSTTLMNSKEQGFFLLLLFFLFFDIVADKDMHESWYKNKDLKF